MRAVNELGLEIKDQRFEAACDMELLVKLNQLQRLKEKVQLLNDLGYGMTLYFPDEE